MGSSAGRRLAEVGTIPVAHRRRSQTVPCRPCRCQGGGARPGVRESVDGVTLRAVAAVVVAILLVAAVLAVAARRQRSGTVADVARRLPGRVGELAAAGADERYPAAAIFTYLDGGAEVYLAYNLRECLARRYTGPPGELVVDVFDMGSSADAFGVFTHDLDGEPAAVGQGARLRPGWLSAWKGAFFVSVTADRDDAAAQAALLELGRAVAAAVPGEGPPPALLRSLPADGLEPGRVAYVHDHVTLSSHVSLPGGNPLGLGKGTEVAVGRYGRGTAAPAVLLVRYADGVRAAAGASALSRAWGAAAEATTRGDDGRWRGVAMHGRDLAVAVGFADEGAARARIAAALAAAS